MNAKPLQASHLPTTLTEAIRYFANPDFALQFMVEIRWPNGVECPTCGSKDVRFIPTRRIWECKCKHAKRQFSVKVGTVFEDSALPIDKWLIAIWTECNCKNSISSYELAGHIGVTQKSAWFMQQRIRLAMQTGSFKAPLKGHVEVDETFIGGKARNMHPGKFKAKGGKGGTAGKAVVLGILERHGDVRLKVVDGTKRRTLHPEVVKHVEPGTTVYTDSLPSYNLLQFNQFVHQVIDHAESYVRGNVHTNGLENFWSLFKRCMATHVSVEPFHLFRYLDAEAFRYNNRKATALGRFLLATAGIVGKRLTYKSLIGEAEKDLPPAMA
jgi:transposase-like protein